MIAQTLWNSSQNHSALDETSMRILSFQLGSCYAWILVGTSGMIGNGALIFLILQNKKLRTNFYISRVHVAVAHLLFCLFSVIISLKRLTLYYLDVAETTTPMNCLWYFYPTLVFENAGFALAFPIAIDRLFRIWHPLKYQTSRTELLQSINFAVWLVVFASISYATTYLNTSEFIPVCTVAQIWQMPFIGVFHNGVGIAFNFISIFVYVSILTILTKKIRTAKSKGKCAFVAYY